MSWDEAKTKAGCSCERSDAWRCAVGRRSKDVACPCVCHSYLRWGLPLPDRSLPQEGNEK